MSSNWILFSATEYTPRDTTTYIEWLDTAIELAKHLVNLLLEDSGRLAESGKASVLKTDDTEK